MKRPLILAALAALAALAVPGVAQAAVPRATDRADAKRFARDYWEDRGYYAPCSGVRVRVTHLGRNTMGGVARRGACTIWLNRDVDWTHRGKRAAWWQVCATVIHEYGHVVGKRHSRNPNSIMAASVEANTYATWWPYFNACRYDGDDEDGDGLPDQ
jgi:hypothetical protein